MKITINFKDIQKLIKEAYNGVNEVMSEHDDMEIMIDVDGDKFSKKTINTINNTGTIPNRTVPINSNSTKIVEKFKPGDKIDYETLILRKEMEQEEKVKQDGKLATETHIPLVKTLEEKNTEARSKGLMTSGRGTQRTIIRS